MGWVANATSRPLYPRERPGTHCIGGWVGPIADVNRCGKSRPPPGFDPRTVQPVGSRYTDWAIPGRTVSSCRHSKTSACTVNADRTVCSCRHSNTSACTVYADRAVCSCRHSKTSACTVNADRTVCSCRHSKTSACTVYADPTVCSCRHSKWSGNMLKNDKAVSKLSA